MQEEVDQKTIALAVKTGKLTGQVLQAAMKKFLAARQKGKAKSHHGHQSLRQLKKDGSALSNIKITDANIGLFMLSSIASSCRRCVFFPTSLSGNKNCSTETSKRVTSS